MGTRVVTVNDILDGHVGLDLEQGKGKFTLGSRCDGP